MARSPSRGHRTRGKIYPVACFNTIERFLLFLTSVAQLGKLRNGHGCRRAQSKRNAGAVITALVRTRRRHAAATWVAARRNNLIRAQKIEFEIAHTHSAQYDS